MNLNFELILFYAVAISGIISLYDILFLEKNRNKEHDKLYKNALTPPEKNIPLIIDYARSFFPVLFIVFCVRSFLYEPFRIPSSSLEPTLLVGDFILVNKYDYGIRLPVMHKKIVPFNNPKHGDIIVFRWPPNPTINFIKRVIGLPGDHISYVNKVLYVNGEKIPQVFVKMDSRINENGNKQSVLVEEEDLFGIKHKIYQNDHQNSEDFNDVVVPPGLYFVMGDNRDDSADSRFWGYVPDANIVGKAVLVWMSWDSLGNWTHKIRWDRLMRVIH